MTYTDTDRDTLTVLAGPNFTWSDATGDSRPPSSYLGRKGFRGIMRADLLARQGGICPWHGGPVVGDGEFCHNVARGPKGRGWLPGNMHIGCAACNDCRAPGHDVRTPGPRTCGDDAPCEFHYGPILDPSAFARPDLVPSEWTPRPVLARR